MKQSQSNKISSHLFIACILVGLLYNIRCNQGLAPENSGGTSNNRPYGIQGVVKFKNWPPQDSIKDLRLGVLQHYPVADIVNEVLQGRAKFTDRLSYGVDSLSYTLTLSPLPSGQFPFVGIAQQFGPNAQTDWRIVGIYYANGDTTKPGVVTVPSDSIVPNININVDFLHLPPQP